MGKFKTFLNEEKNNFKIYLDMDGCITSFVSHVENTFNTKINDFFKDDENSWKLIKSKGEDFWSKMPPMKDFKKLISFLNKNGGYTILTSAGSPKNETKEAISGKRKWSRNI